MPYSIFKWLYIYAKCLHTGSYSKYSCGITRGLKVENVPRLFCGGWAKSYTHLHRPATVTPHSLPTPEDDPAFQQSMVEGGGAQRAVVDLLVEQVGLH